ncbi:hypothetical protein G8T71_10700 [Clostridium botulinum C/D]|uniref:phage tail assembly chaperone n=1 Tax=Clostridium botulinum TaxID=1491 RepID=UPI001E2CE460|nr:hypothetical protein [Clostridium botulinum]MCD3211824.1 hypothetical protein [Clostridium botulinum C/D]
MSQFEDFLMDSFEEVQEVERELEIGGRKRKMKFKAIGATRADGIRKDCRNIKFVKGQKIVETDQDKYLETLIVETTICPDLKNAELQANWGVMGSVELLQAMKTKMTDGEYSEWSNVVSEINGYDKGIQELMEEAKN